MNYTKMILTIFALPLMITMLWQEGACQQRRKTRLASKQMGSIRQGTWGGKGVVLEVSGSGASIEYDCGYGSISEPIVPDKNGHFEVKGTHVTERPGPVHVGQDDGERPAIYSGSVDGETLDLTVRLSETKKTIGTYTLAYGKRSRIRKCL